MGFKHKKREYENIFAWDKEGKGTCFYCKEDQALALKLIREKGICERCLKDFEIGNVGADRHVIERILPKDFKSYKEVVKWFEDRGIKMILKNVMDIDGKIYSYDAINNEAAYKRYHKAIKEDGIVPIDKDFINASNTVEISEDGSDIHIIY